MNDNLEHYHTLDGSTPRARRASLAAARACYRKRFGVEPPPGRVFRLRPAVAVAFALPLTHSGLTCHNPRGCSSLAVRPQTARKR